MRGRSNNSLISGVALVVLLFLCMALLGCGGGGSDGNDNSGRWASRMSKVPKDAAMFTFEDVAAMRADGDLHKYYDDCKKEIEPDCEALGISADVVDRMSKGYSGYVFVILEGRFDLDEVREGLETKGYQKGQYKEFETWEDNSAAVEAFALVSESCIAIGDDIHDLKHLLDVINGDDHSLDDDQDMSDFMDRLPDGIVAAVHTYETYRGCEITGYSVKKQDSNTVSLTMLLLFNGEDSASDAMEDIEQEYDNSQVARDGRYITVSAVSDIE